MSDKKSGNIDLSDLKHLGPALGRLSKAGLRYAGMMFFLLVAVVYGFVVLQINTLSNAQPTDSDVSAQTKTTAVPNVDPKVVQQLQTLQDNSSNVQTLFQQARENPFQE